MSNQRMTQRFSQKSVLSQLNSLTNFSVHICLKIFPPGSDIRNDNAHQCVDVQGFKSWKSTITRQIANHQEPPRCCSPKSLPPWGKTMFCQCVDNWCMEISLQHDLWMCHVPQTLRKPSGEEIAQRWPTYSWIHGASIHHTCPRYLWIMELCLTTN